MSKLVLKICTGTWNNASRDKRELSVCQELGFETLVLAKGDPEGRGREEDVEGYRVLRCSTRPLGNRIPDPVNRIAALFTWARVAGELRPAVISGHDIIGVLIGWMSNAFRKNKAKLVYDSHEFEIGRNANRSPLQTWWIMHLERFLIKRCAFSIMVNDSIADEVQRVHKLEQRPIVVRSTPEKWVLDPEKSREQRNGFLRQMPKARYLLMYHGFVTSGRGVENTIRVAAHFDDVGVVVLGHVAADTYKASLEELIEREGMKGRVLFHEAVPHSALSSYISAVDVSTILSDIPGKSYYYGLPNKFFESIQSLVPIVSTALPEIQRIIDQYGIGLTCPVGDIEAAVSCIRRMREETELYARMKENLPAAKNDLCWEKEKKVLIKEYSKLLR